MTHFPTTTVKTVRVLVADQSSTVRRGLRMFLESEPGLEFAGDVSDAYWLRWAFRVVEPDVIVLDCALPGDRLDALVEDLRVRQPGARIVVLDSNPWPAAALRASGADAYVSKCASPDVLRTALRPLADRQN